MPRFTPKASRYPSLSGLEWISMISAGRSTSHASGIPARVERQLPLEVSLHRGVHYLDQEEHVARFGMLPRIEVVARFGQHHVGLRLRIDIKRIGSCRRTTVSGAASLFKTLLSLPAHAAWRLPMGLISNTSPAMSSTWSSSERIPTSAIRWYSWTLKRLFSTRTGTSSRFVLDETIVRDTSPTLGDSRAGKRAGTV